LICQEFFEKNIIFLFENEKASALYEKTDAF